MNPSLPKIKNSDSPVHKNEYDEKENEIKYFDTGKRNFADLIRSQVKKYKKKDNCMEILANQKEKDYLFLQKDHTFINSNSKSLFTRLELNEKRKELEFQLENKPKFDIYNTKLYETQNPNIDYLLKDIGSQSKINQLQDQLKNEFDEFLSFSIENSKFSVRNTLIKDHMNHKDSNIENRNEWNFLTQETMDGDESMRFINQKSETHKTLENKIEKLKPSDKNTEVNKINKQAIIDCKLKNETTMQIALTENNRDENLNNTSLIKLNKIIEGIKRIDLPKFQPELHQICQYVSDSEILKVYPEVISLRKNNLTCKKENKYIKVSPKFGMFQKKIIDHPI